jgi:ADP-heptose:LPS heptosyltransferase
LKDYIIRILDTVLFTPIKRAAFSRFKSVQRICFINMGGLGDYMLFSPMIALCRAQVPDARLTLLTAPNYAAVDELFSELDEVVILQPDQLHFGSLLSLLRQGRFDALIVNHDFAISSWALSLAIAFSGIPIRVGCGRSALRSAVLTASTPDRSENQNDYLMDLFYEATGVFFELIQQTPKTAMATKSLFAKNKPPDLMAHYRYQNRLEEKAWLDTLLDGQHAVDASPKIVIHPGSSKNSKAENWHKSWPVQSWCELIAQLTQRYPTGVIYLTGGPEDALEVEAIALALEGLPAQSCQQVVNLYGQVTTTSSLAELLSEADVFIGCDSFAMHLALFTDTPLVAIFALTNEKRFLPSGNPRYRAAVRTDLPCRPCYPITRNASCENPICQQVPVSTVLSHVQELLPVPVAVSISKPVHLKEPASRSLAGAT